jgi:hypothetical protein
VFIIGTAHVSLESVKETRALIRQACPHQVFLELCSGRRALLEPHLVRICCVASGHSSILPMVESKQGFSRLLKTGHAISAYR